MKSGHDKLAHEIASRAFSPLGSVKIVSNTTAEYHTDDTIKDTLAAHMHSPVYWKKSMERLFADGFDTFIEVGPGKVLSGFMKSIDRSKKCYAVCDAASLEATVKAVKGN
jgi:[acyl-carrier-protein] S-malonyltransferase